MLSPGADCNQSVSPNAALLAAETGQASANVPVQEHKTWLGGGASCCVWGRGGELVPRTPSGSLVDENPSRVMPAGPEMGAHVLKSCYCACRLFDESVVFFPPRRVAGSDAERHHGSFEVHADYLVERLRGLQ